MPPTPSSSPVQGMIEVEVEYEDQKAKLPLVIVDGKGLTLLGRNWLHHLRLDWSQLHNIQTDAHEADIQSITLICFKRVLGRYQVRKRRSTSTTTR